MLVRFFFVGGFEADFETKRLEGFVIPRDLKDGEFVTRFLLIEEFVRDRLAQGFELELEFPVRGVASSARLSMIEWFARRGISVMFDQQSRFVTVRNE